MPMVIEELDDGLGVLLSASGEVTEKEYLSTIETHLARPEVGKYRYNLSDYTAVERVDVSSQAVRRVAEMCRSAARAQPGVVLAVVAERDLTFGLSRMWQAYASDTGWETEIFRSRVEAEAWLRDRVEKRWALRPALQRSGRILAASP